MSLQNLQGTTNTQGISLADLKDLMGHGKPSSFSSKNKTGYTERDNSIRELYNAKTSIDKQSSKHLQDNSRYKGRSLFGSNLFGRGGTFKI